MGHSLVFGAFWLCQVIARQKTKHSAGSVWAVQGDLHKGENFPEKPAAAMQTAVFGGNEAEMPVPGLFREPCTAQEMKQVRGYGEFCILGKAELLEKRKGKYKILVSRGASGFGGQFAGGDTPVYHPLQHGFGFGDLLSAGLPSGKNNPGLRIVPQVFLGGKEPSLQKP